MDTRHMVYTQVRQDLAIFQINYRIVQITQMLKFQEMEQWQEHINIPLLQVKSTIYVIQI